MKAYQTQHFTVKRIATEPALEASAGGKAQGLQRLLQAGLRVPPAFVCIPNGSSGNGGSEIETAYRELGEGSVAVRSSAPDEDGVFAAAAGQYETCLNIEGTDGLHEAVERCLASAHSSRAEAYRRNRNSGSSEVSMAVIVQRMITPVKAGVLFTADPVSGETDWVRVEAVSGCGDTLVSGYSSGETYRIDRKSGEITDHSDDTLLSQTEVQQLLQGSLTAESSLGCPLDMEWAIDSEGILHWLQARPVTTAAPDSLDTPIGDDELITRCNIGEMLPGAATPLTLSVFAEPLNWGMMEMYRREGVLKGVTPVPRFINHVENHLFMNLTSMYIMARKVAGASREAIELNILGRVLPRHDIGPNGSRFSRCINGVRYFMLVFGHNRFLRKITKLGKRFKIPLENRSAAELYAQLCSEQKRVLNKAYLYHYFVSSYSGAMNGILAAVLSGGKDVTKEAHGQMGILLTDIPGIESAALSENLSRIAGEINGSAGENLCTLPGKETRAVQWLRGPESGEAGRLFEAFLHRHGHRCIREAELRSKDYETYPEELVPFLRERIRGIRRNSCNRTKPDPASPQKQEQTVEAPKWVLKKAKEGVRQREYSKSMLILIQHQFKKGYRKLAELLRDAGILPDTDLIYFFTRGEIGELVKAPDARLLSPALKRLIRLAETRRRELPYQMELQFPEVSRGKPKPVSMPEGPTDGSSGGLFEGTPVSRGIAEGIVRVVKTVDDGYRLRSGEIMVAPFTDIGWTPFFSGISGLVTEIGGALSHGAVVAREYGLPMVSNIPGITSRLQTGTKIRLDGRAGTVKVL